jgi:hypothetical protein
MLLKTVTIVFDGLTPNILTLHTNNGRVRFYREFKKLIKIIEKNRTSMEKHLKILTLKDLCESALPDTVKKAVKRKYCI